MDVVPVGGGHKRYPCGVLASAVAQGSRGELRRSDESTSYARFGPGPHTQHVSTGRLAGAALLSSGDPASRRGSLDHGLHDAR